MKYFQYTAFSAHGQSLEGFLYAKDRSEVRATLIEAGMHPKEIREAFPWWNVTKVGFHKKPKVEDYMHFASQLGASLQAGMPLLASLELLCEQTTSHTMLHHIAQRTLQYMHAGCSFSKAVALLPWKTPNTLQHYILWGEAQGDLGTALQYSADLMQKRLTYKKEWQSQLVYPFILVLLFCFTLSLMLFVLLPMIGGLYASEESMPSYMRWLLSIGDFVERAPYLVLLLILAPIWVVAFFFYTQYKKSCLEPNFWNRIYRLPYIGPWVQQQTFVLFSFEMATLLESGYTLMACYDIFENRTTTPSVRAYLNLAKTTLQAGKGAHRSLVCFRFIPESILSFLYLAEQRGTLAQTLKELSISYEKALQIRRKTYLKIAEPVMILLFGMLVLALALLFFLPLLDGYQALLNGGV